MRDDDKEVRRRLRGAAQAHRPDRERMLARVEQGMARRERPGEHRPKPPLRAGASWLRVVTATAAVAGVCAVAGYGVASALRGEDPDPQSVATSSTPTPDTPPTATEENRTAAPPPPRRPSGTPVKPPASRAPESHKPSQSARPPRGPKSVPAAELLWADGSIDPGSSTYWSQSEVTLKARKPLTSLTVELRVAREPEVADTGNWRSLPAEDFDVSVGERGGFLVYRWTLKAGRTVPAGEHVFAGQFDHDEGKRDAGGDRYTIRAATPDERTEWRGDFF